MAGLGLHKAIQHDIVRCGPAVPGSSDSAAMAWPGRAQPCRNIARRQHGVAPPRAALGSNSGAKRRAAALRNGGALHRCALRCTATAGPGAALRSTATAWPGAALRSAAMAVPCAALHSAAMAVHGAALRCRATAWPCAALLSEAMATRGAALHSEAMAVRSGAMRGNCKARQSIAWQPNGWPMDGQWMVNGWPARVGAVAQHCRMMAPLRGTTTRGILGESTAGRCDAQQWQGVVVWGAARQQRSAAARSRAWQWHSCAALGFTMAPWHGARLGSARQRRGGALGSNSGAERGGAKLCTAMASRGFA